MHLIFVNILPLAGLTTDFEQYFWGGIFIILAYLMINVSLHIYYGKNFELFNATFYPCPTIYDYVKSISSVLNITKNHISFPKAPIKFLIHITSFITKNLKSNSSFHYIRLNKLFISNFIKPSFLLSKNYSFKYSLKSSMEDWK